MQPAQRTHHLLRFRGSAHPPGQDDSYDGVFLTQSEIKQKAKTVVGTPIWYEHEGCKKVGWVTKGSVDAEGRLIVDGVIDRTSVAGVKAARGLQSGSLKGLSLGLEHLKMKDDKHKLLKIVSKAIEEVSLTSDPDLPDTAISSVALDSEMWNLSKQSVTQTFRERKTKTQVLKNRAELERLRKEESERKTKVMATPAEQPVATPTQEVTEMDALRQQLDAQQKRVTELEAEKISQDQELAIHRTVEGTPEAEQKAIIARDEMRKQKLSAEMAEDEAVIIERITADIVAAGGKPNDELIALVKQGKDRPDGYKPLHKYMKSQAGAAATLRATEMEVKYQAEVQQNAIQRKEMEALRDRLTTSDTAQHQQQQHQQAQIDAEQRKADYGQFVSGTNDPTSRKRARADQEPEPVAAAAPVNVMGSTGADVTFGSMVAPVGVAFLSAGIQPAVQTGQDDLLSMFESMRAQRMQPSEHIQLLSTSGMRPSVRAPASAVQSLFDAR